MSNCFVTAAFSLVNIWTSFTIRLLSSGISLCPWKVRENCLPQQYWNTCRRPKKKTLPYIIYFLDNFLIRSDNFSLQLQCMDYLVSQYHYEVIISATLRNDCWQLGSHLPMGIHKIEFVLVFSSRIKSIVLWLTVELLVSNGKKKGLYRGWDSISGIRSALHWIQQTYRQKVNCCL